MLRVKMAVAGLLLAVAGCSGGTKFAPVSGVVTLNGRPYGKAVVSFQPIGSAENPNPGRGSSATTDANGRFVLKCDGEIDGALVGRHRVRIMTVGDVVGADPTTSGTGSSDETKPGGKEIDPIPPEWNALSDVEFDVPPKGSDRANFDIVNPKVP